ncbi:tripartite tricarboxylate transporter TctB family protein [Cohaesibacter celericrescens]|uniref:Tripartite tricarboxylate transporter TctB family protein n=1 Tax=Cohaesibacter celericrescens TaxID=2067669 RepID=A0A2N5XLD0_9HYPH|nr:tripartite tricarboxylate transporter TctB family protein [Cohaesibacter celericrescens]PLW75319.1 tripartite tricarboxylate transporter TctB family protein [Cohaesibacter celericrescens]
MINKDVLTGSILAGFGAWFSWEAKSFPTLGGMTQGPGLFPTIAGIGLVVCGLLVLTTGLIEMRRTDGPHEVSPPMSRQAWINSFAVIFGVILFAVFLDTLGFHLVALPLTLGLFILFGITWWKSLLLSVGVTVLVHLIFYSFLHVPLPWGLLEAYAW